MLNGVDPIILIQFYKAIPTATLSKIPKSSLKNKATIAVVPIYLSQKISGLIVDSESKNIDINTDLIGKTSGDPTDVDQTPLGSVTTINLKGETTSTGLNVLLALSELILDKASSQEYEITYMHKGITVFGGLLHGFSYEEGSNDDLYRIKVELTRGRPKANSSLAIQDDPNNVRLGSTGVTPAAGASTIPANPAPSRSVITPKMGSPT